MKDRYWHLTQNPFIVGYFLRFTKGRYSIYFYIINTRENDQVWCSVTWSGTVACPVSRPPCWKSTQILDCLWGLLSLDMELIQVPGEQLQTLLSSDGHKQGHLELQYIILWYIITNQHMENSMSSVIFPTQKELYNHKCPSVHNQDPSTFPLSIIILHLSIISWLLSFSACFIFNSPLVNGMSVELANESRREIREIDF